MIHWKTFSVEGADSIIAMLDKLEASTQPLWGKMSVSKMVKHCQIPYLEIEGKSRGPFSTILDLYDSYNSSFAFKIYFLSKNILLLPFQIFSLLTLNGPVCIQ